MDMDMYVLREELGKGFGSISTPAMHCVSLRFFSLFIGTRSVVYAGYQRDKSGNNVNTQPFAVKVAL